MRRLVEFPRVVAGRCETARAAPAGAVRARRRVRLPRSSTPSARFSPTIRERVKRDSRSASPRRTCWPRRSAFWASARPIRCKRAVGLIAGILTALWLLGLLAAAPALRHGARYAFADRLRDALILGAAIPFALGIADVLYPAACWIVLATCVAIAYRRAPPAIENPVRQRSRPPYVLIAALALVAWPPLMRPLLDGDTLSYHLPNAAAWVHAHGLWTTDARYWWYPPGSEIFASGLFAVSGPFGAGMERLRRTRPDRISRRRLGERRVRFARMARRRAGRRNRHDDAACDASRFAAERRVACRVLSRIAVGAAPPTGRGSVDRRAHRVAETVRMDLRRGRRGARRARRCACGSRQRRRSGYGSLTTQYCGTRRSLRPPVRRRPINPIR